MPTTAAQRNMGYQKYLDDQGNEWNVFGEIGGFAAGVDGHVALDNTKPTFGRQSRNRHVRYAVYQDNTTFRKLRFIVYTPTAYAALGAGATLNVKVPGDTANVEYTLLQKIGERQPFANPARTLADHVTP